MSSATIHFTTVEVWTTGGLVTCYLLFVMEIATRRVHFAGCTPSPDEVWMRQIGQNLADAEDGFLIGKRYVLMDRDGKFCPAFRAVLKTEGVKAVLLPPRSPNLNAHLERFHRSLKEECLERMIFFGETLLRNAIREIWPITTENEITRAWRIGSSFRATKSDSAAARSNAASDWVACCDTIIVRRRRRGVHLGHTPADGLRRAGQRQHLAPEAARPRPSKPALSTEIHPAYRLQHQPLTAPARHSSFLTTREWFCS